VSWRSGCLTGTLDSAGGVVWCLAGQPLEAVKPGFSHILAAACDDGSVRLFGVEGGEPGAQLERTLAVLQV
jgi:U3 small nucleolar RNA-associated protein 4